ncbi:MAG: group 1 glycosyl transferase [Bacteroidetes bacterium B1(2017)]|nr:MAG: group 1 glycosyl transferase [Bacteroidetes bacterium B1(2017)]
MRIGIEAQRIFRKKKHGMDMVALELIRALQKIETPHQFFIFVQNDEDAACLSESKNVSIIALPNSPYPIWEQWHLPRAAKKYKLDVLHCTSNTAPLFLSVPLVLTLHDIIYLEKISLSQGTAYQKFGNIYRKWNVPLIVKKAVSILTVSDFERTRILSYFKFPEDRVQTAYNGVGTHFKRITDANVLAEAKDKFKLPNEFIFFLGNTDPKKNVIGVLKALSILKKKNQLPCKLLMLDINREYLSNLAQQIGDPSVLDEISFTGYVPNVQLPAIYSQASLFLYPSLRESFGIPLVEAMKCEVPIITSNTSSMPEIVADSALICDPFAPETIANAILELWSNKPLQQELVAKAKVRSELFSWDANAKQTLKIYEQIST